jgi:hypothetical protein
MVHLDSITVNVFVPNGIDEKDRERVERALGTLNLEKIVTDWVKQKEGLDVSTTTSQP